MSIICTLVKWPTKPKTGLSLGWQKVFHDVWFSVIAKSLAGRSKAQWQKNL